jgi:hypothetical protein
MLDERIRPGRALPLPCLACLIVAVLTPASPTAQATQLPPPARPPKPAAQAARASAAELPSARSIVDRHIAAIGGREAVLSHTSMHATGTVSIPSAGIMGTVEIFGAKPNRSMVRISLAGVGESSEGFNGAVGWEISPVTGPTLLEGKELEEKKFDADFYDELHEGDRYSSMTTVERTVFEGRPCYRLRLVRKTGGEDTAFYDVETGLKAGGIQTRETQMGKVTATIVESDYRKFGNLMHATKATLSAMGIQQVITLSVIEYDNVPDSAFDLPPAIKTLLK